MVKERVPRRLRARSSSASASVSPPGVRRSARKRLPSWRVREDNLIDDGSMGDELDTVLDDNESPLELVLASDTTAFGDLQVQDVEGGRLILPRFNSSSYIPLDERTTKLVSSDERPQNKAIPTVSPDEMYKAEAYVEPCPAGSPVSCEASTLSIEDEDLISTNDQRLVEQSRELSPLAADRVHFGGSDTNLSLLSSVVLRQVPSVPVNEAEFVPFESEFVGSGIFTLSTLPSRRRSRGREASGPDLKGEDAAFVKEANVNDPALGESEGPHQAKTVVENSHSQTGTEKISECEGNELIRRSSLFHSINDLPVDKPMKNVMVDERTVVDDQVNTSAGASARKGGASEEKKKRKRRRRSASIVSDSARLVELNDSTQSNAEDHLENLASLNDEIETSQGVNAVVPTVKRKRRRRRTVDTAVAKILANDMANTVAEYLPQSDPPSGGKKVTVKVARNKAKPVESTELTTGRKFGKSLGYGDATVKSSPPEPIIVKKRIGRPPNSARSLAFPPANKVIDVFDLFESNLSAAVSSEMEDVVLDVCGYTCDGLVRSLRGFRILASWRGEFNEQLVLRIRRGKLLLGLDGSGSRIRGITDLLDDHAPLYRFLSDRDCAAADALSSLANSLIEKHCVYKREAPFTISEAAEVDGLEDDLVLMILHVDPNEEPTHWPRGLVAVDGNGEAVRQSGNVEDSSAMEIEASGDEVDDSMHTSESGDEEQGKSFSIELKPELWIARRADLPLRDLNDLQRCQDYASQAPQSIRPWVKQLLERGKFDPADEWYGHGADSDKERLWKRRVSLIFSFRL